MNRLVADYEPGNISNEPLSEIISGVLGMVLGSIGNYQKE
jgi:hypothetical protein